MLSLFDDFLPAPSLSTTSSLHTTLCVSRVRVLGAPRRRRVPEESPAGGAFWVCSVSRRVTVREASVMVEGVGRSAKTDIDSLNTVQSDGTRTQRNFCGGGGVDVVVVGGEEDSRARRRVSAVFACAERPTACSRVSSTTTTTTYPELAIHGRTLLQTTPLAAHDLCSPGFPLFQGAGTDWRRLDGCCGAVLRVPRHCPSIHRRILFL